MVPMVANHAHKKELSIAIITILTFQFAVRAYAAHPLITEDTGTQGRGHSQLELTVEQGWRDEDYSAKHEREFAAAFSYGLRDDLDLIFTVPYQRISTDTGAGIETHFGLSDAGIDLKWRFHVSGDVSMALKPGVTFPTGNENAGIGSGKAGYSLYQVTSVELNPWAFHVHLGYRHHRNLVNERQGIWHVSAAGERKIGTKFKLVGDLGSNTNTDKSSQNESVFLILGMIYSFTPDFDLDFGIKKGLTNVATDYSLLAGITFRY